MLINRPRPDVREQQKLRRTVEEALPLWDLALAGEPSPVADSVSNANFRVPTNNGDFFLRIHRRSRTRERLELEHRLIAWMGERGIPVNHPLPSTNGQTLRSTGGRFVALFPWLDVHTLPAPGLGEPGAALLGELHGCVQSTMTGFDDPSLSICPIARPWDTENSIEALSRVDDLIRYYPSPGEWQLEVQEMLRFKLALLESPAALPYANFEDMPTQPCHGDFHERNVLLNSAGAVVAVADWEMAGRMPPLFELLQSLTWLHLIESPHLETYVSAYAASISANASLVGQAVEMWWQASLHNTWSFTDVFVRGERGASRFFETNDHHLRLYADPSFRAALTDRIIRALP